MALNPLMLLKLRSRVEVFHQDHPKVLPFLKKVSAEALEEGGVLALSVTRPDGKAYSSNIRINANDVETVRMLLELLNNEDKKEE